MATDARGNQSRAVIQTVILTMPSSPVISSSIEIRPVSSPPPVFATADMLSDIAQCKELFYTAASAAFADIVVAGDRETCSIRRSTAPACPWSDALPYQPAA
jgi:hypothetical protein